MAVYRYTVCWRTKSCRPYQWKYEEFANKEKAQEFAKKTKKLQKNHAKQKPYIIQTIVNNSYFDNGTIIEPVYNCKLKFYEFEKKIRY